MNRTLCAYPWRKLVLLTTLLYMLNLGTGWLAGQPFTVPGASVFELYFCLGAAALLQSALVLELVRRSAWRGFKLGLAVFTVYFGVVAFQTWIEAWLFLNLFIYKMSAREVHLGLVQGFAVAAAAGALAVCLAAPREAPAVENPASSGLPGRNWPRWALRLTGVSLLYVFIFFLFGMFVALPLAGPAYQEFYKDLRPSVWLPLIELGRGLIWGLLAVLIVQMLDLERNKAALLTGLLFSLLVGAMLISPNAIIDSDRMRWSHFVEVSTSNFVFGWLAVRILTRKKALKQVEPSLSAQVERL